MELLNHYDGCRGRHENSNIRFLAKSYSSFRLLRIGCSRISRSCPILFVPILAPVRPLFVLIAVCTLVWMPVYVFTGFRNPRRCCLIGSLGHLIFLGAWLGAYSLIACYLLFEIAYLDNPALLMGLVFALGFGLIITARWLESRIITFFSLSDRELFKTTSTFVSRPTDILTSLISESGAITRGIDLGSFLYYLIEHVRILCGSKKNGSSK